LPFEIEQDERLAQRRRHLRERALEERPVLAIERRVLGRRLVGRRGEHRLGAARRDARRVRGEVARDPRDPGADTVGVAQPVEVAPRGDERLLRDVLGERRIAAPPERYPEHQVLVAGDERPERLGVPPAALRHQLGVGRGISGHHAPWWSGAEKGDTESTGGGVVQGRTCGSGWGSPSA
jgi:hypothetical protein